MTTGASDEGRTVAVVGVGAIGGYVGSLAADAGHALTLCVRTPIDRLVVEKDDELREVPATIATDPGQVDVVDWVFLATKEQDTPTTAPWLERLVGPDTVVVVLQNGVSHRERVEPLAPRGRVLPALVYITVEPVERGHVRHSFGGRIQVDDDIDAPRFRTLLAGADVEVEVVEDFLTAAWQKLLGNVVANPLTALTMRRSEVLREPHMQELSDRLLREAIAVGRSVGADLGDEDRRALLEALANIPGENGTSMLFDRLAGKPLEFEAITGYLVETGDRQDVPTPTNRTILTLLRALDGYLRGSGQAAQSRS